MHPMVIDRRSFIAGVAGFVGPIVAPIMAPGARAESRRNVIAAATRQPDGSFAAVIYDLDNGLLSKAALPARGHDIAVNPVSGTCVAFARRPGTFAIAFGGNPARPPIAFSAPPGRHFYGHGVFSRDGRLLYTTENAFDDGTGRIGIWETAGNYRRVGEILSHGIGPHDINLVPDGRTLVIANGGTITHPEHGRRVLNLATMQPSLAYVDTTTGDLIERHVLPAALHKLSIRHLDVAGDGTIVFGCQNKGPRSRQVDLIGFHRPGGDIAFLSGGTAVHRALRHYVSSIAINRAGDLAVVTSSRGQQAVFVDIARRSVVGIQPFRDVSGVAAAGTESGFVLTGGGGDITERTERSAVGKQRRVAWHWDNHAIALDL